MFCWSSTIVQLRVQESELKKTSKIWLDSNLGIRQPSCKSPDVHLHFLFPNFLMHDKKLQDKKILLRRVRIRMWYIFFSSCFNYCRMDSKYNVYTSALLSFQGEFSRIVLLPWLFPYKVASQEHHLQAEVGLGLCSRQIIYL